MPTSRTLPPAPQLGEQQRQALALAAAERWCVAVEASDGTRATLHAGGRPGRLLVLRLAGPEEGLRPEE